METDKISEEKDETKESNKFNEIVKKNWPLVKEEMEKRAQHAKKLIAQGEKHFVEFTDISMKKLRKLSLNHKKDKHYQELGRIVASLSKEEIADNSEVMKLIEEIKTIESEANSL